MFSSSVQRYAFLRWLAAAGLLIAWTLSKNSSGRTDLVFGIALLALIVSAFFWPRCPHCNSRVVQFNKREWIPNSVCWKCGRPYDEDNTSLEEVQIAERVEAAYKLRKKDPAAFESAMREMEDVLSAAEDKRRAKLRAEAAYNPGAAKKLRGRLMDELKFVQQSVKRFEKQRPTQPNEVANLESLRRQEHELRAEIDALGT